MRLTSRAAFQKQVPRGSVKAVYLSCCWINSQVSDVCQNLFLRELPFLYNRSVCGPQFPVQSMGSMVSSMVRDSPVHTPWVVDAFSYEGEANDITGNSLGGSVPMLSKPTQHWTLCWRDEAVEAKCLDGASEFCSPSNKQTHGRYVKQRLVFTDLLFQIPVSFSGGYSSLYLRVGLQLTVHFKVLVLNPFRLNLL